MPFTLSLLYIVYFIMYKVPVSPYVYIFIYIHAHVHEFLITNLTLISRTYTCNFVFE